MALPPPPAGIDLAADKRGEFTGVAVATWVLGLAMVILRVLGRRMRALPLWFDDWCVIAALPPALCHVLAMGAYAVSRGFGKHVWAAEPDGVYAWALGLFVAEICYTLTLVCVKLSILAFYWRSFAVRESIKPPVLILAAIVSIWGVAVLLVTFLQCSPTRAVWQRFDPVSPLPPSEYTCGVDSLKFFYGNAIPTIVTDLMMLSLPVPYIMRLQLPTAQKLALGCIFLVGIFVTIVSVVRFVFLLRTDLSDPDITWNFVEVGLWSIVEGNIGIVCACLPFLKPVLSRISFGFLDFSTVSFGSAKKSKHSGSSRPSKDLFRSWGVSDSLGTSTTHVKSLNRDAPEQDEHPFARIADDTSENEQKGPSYELDEVNPPSRGIMVTRGVHQHNRPAG